MVNATVKNKFPPKTWIANFPADYKKTFSIYTGLLKCIGIDFFGAELGPQNINSSVRLFIFNIIFLPFILVQLHLVYKMKADNFLEGAAIIPIVLMFALDVIKMTLALTKRGEIIQIFIETGELWPTQLEDAKAVVIKNWLQRMNVLVKSFFIYAVVNLVTFEVVPFVATCFNIHAGLNEYIFPFQPPGFWKVNSTAVFLATYAWEVAATVPCQLCLYLPYDLIIVTTASNISILLRLLQVDIENAIKTLPVRQVGTLSANIADLGSYAEIRRIVKKHQRLLSIVEKLNNSFGLVIFIHVAFSSIEICFFGFLTVVFGGVAETIANLLTVLNAVITIFLLALSGQLLCDTSLGVAEAAYKSLWYQSDFKVKKLVLFIIIRSQRPCYLSALGYSNMTLSSFSKIMSSAWTYFSLLIQLYEDN